MSGLLTVIVAAPLPGQVRIGTITLTDQQAPGFDPPAAFSAGRSDYGFLKHRRPHLNDSGQIVFASNAYIDPVKA